MPGFIIEHQALRLWNGLNIKTLMPPLYLIVYLYYTIFSQQNQSNTSNINECSLKKHKKNGIIYSVYIY